MKRFCFGMQALNRFLSVIPNCPDTELWQPMEQASAREVLGAPVDALPLFFGAISGGHDPSISYDNLYLLILFDKALF